MMCTPASSEGDGTAEEASASGKGAGTGVPAHVSVGGDTTATSVAGDDGTGLAARMSGAAESNIGGDNTKDGGMAPASREDGGGTRGNGSACAGDGGTGGSMRAGDYGATSDDTG